MMEIWTPLAGYENLYYVSNLGNIQNKRTGKILKQYMSNSGYMKVCLFKDKKKKNHLVHRLVLTTFVPNPRNLPQVNHKNGDKTNNLLSNLEWCSPSDNIKHAYKNGLYVWSEERRNKARERGSKRDMSYLNKASVLANKGRKRPKEVCEKISRSHKGIRAQKIICIETGEVFSSIQEASEKFGVCHEAIRSAVHKKTKSCGFRFDLLENTDE